MAWLWLLVAMSACHAAPIGGDLRDADGRPLAGQTVWFCADDPGWSAEPCRTTTGADGSFELAVPDACTGPGALLVRVPGRGCAVARAGRNGLLVALRLLPGDAVDGLVLDQRQQPVAGARVRPMMFWLDGGYCRVCPAVADALWPATTDAEGRWRLADLPSEARRDLAVEADGRALGLVGVARGFQPSPASYAILAPGGAVTGRILLPDGRPAARVAVGGEGRYVPTDAEGRFTLPHLPVGEQALRVLRPADADWCEPRELVATVAAGQVVGLPELRLARGVWLRGRVTDPKTGRARIEANVCLLREPDGDASTYTEADGRFALLLEPGTYSLVGAKPPQTITVTADGPPPAPLELTASTGAVALPVRLRDEAGRPIAGGWFRRQSDGRRTVCTPDGWLTLRINPGLMALPDPPIPGAPPPQPEPVKVGVVMAQPWRLGRLTVPADAAQAELTLAECPAAPVSGRVLDADGAPVAGAEVRLRLDLPDCDLLGAGTEDPITVRSSADGSFSLPPVPTGWPGQLSASRPGYEAGESLSLVRMVGEPVARELRLRALTAHIAGRVVDAAGRPVAGAMVMVDGSSAARPQLGAADGSFRIDSLPAGRATVTALHGRRAMASADVALPADGLTLTLAEASAVDWSAAPTDDDRDLALALLRPMLRKQRGGPDDSVPLLWLARLDLAEVLDHLATAPAGVHREDTLLGFLVMLPEEVALGPDIVRLVRLLDDPTLRLMAAWLASRRSSPELAGQLRALSPTPDRLGPRDRTIALLALADLASRAGSDDAPVRRKAALAALTADPQREQAMADLLELGPLTADLMDNFPAPTAGGRADPLLRRRRLEEALRRDPRGALDLARTWWPGPNGAVKWPDSDAWYRGGRTGLLADAALALGEREPDAARALLRQAGASEARMTAQATLALRSRDAAVARGWFADLAADGSFAADEALVMCAARQAPDLAESARRRMLSQACLTAPTSNLETAYAFAAVDPVRSRWVLAASQSAAQADQLLVTLAAVDRPRALALAAEQSTTDEARLALVAWLLSDEADRCARPLHYWRRHGAHPEEELAG